MPNNRRVGRPAAPVIHEPALREAALRVLDREGPAQFTVAAVAAELGVTRAAIHHHAGGREALLAATAEHVLGDVLLPPGDVVEDWRDWVRLLATSYRTVLERHPRVTPVLNAALPTSPAAHEVSQALAAALTSAGLDDDEVAVAHVTVLSFVIGFATLQTSTVSAGTPAAAVNGDEAFQLGLDALLAGLTGARQARTAVRA
jgi:AcrR family transcriptional regulator